MVYVLKNWNTHTHKKKDQQASAMLFKMCTCTKENKKKAVKILREPTSNRPRTTRQKHTRTYRLYSRMHTHSQNTYTKVKIHKTSSRILKTLKINPHIISHHRKLKWSKTHIFLKRVFTRTTKKSLLVSEQNERNKKKVSQSTWTTTETRTLLRGRESLY